MDIPGDFHITLAPSGKHPLSQRLDLDPVLGVKKDKELFQERLPLFLIKDVRIRDQDSIILRKDLIKEAEAIVGGSYGYYTPSFTSDGVIHFEKSREEMPDLEDIQAVTFSDAHSDGNVVITLG